jgi:putative two-component system response regulator
VEVKKMLTNHIATSYPESKILVIDDQKTITLILEKLLNESGYYNVTCVVDPRQAVEIYQKLAPDLVLLDLTMPFLSGFDLLKLFQQYHTDQFIPVIVLTSDQDQESKHTALALGANDFLPKPFDRVELLVRINNTLAIRNQHKFLEQKVAERTQELRETQIEIIQRLVKASEYRDTDTGDHIYRLSILCYHMGRELGFSNEDCENFRYASLMHDIGKIGIPDRILLKPDKLTSEEFEEMKQHTVIGSEMLSDSKAKFLQMAKEIACSHHEKWDGTGYPSKLSGEEIPLVGRITAICDVFDALTSSRPYKKAWPVEQAIEELKILKGNYFDPELTDVFLTVLPSIIGSEEIFAHLREAQSENII